MYVDIWDKDHGLNEKITSTEAPTLTSLGGVIDGLEMKA